MNAPKGTLTAELRFQIAERKAELLKFLRDQAFAAAFVPPPIPRRVSNDPAPLSFAQERLWFLEQLEAGSAVYNICRASRLTGQLNVAALEASLTELLRRHEILRSQIRIVDGRPVQVTATVSTFALPVTDLRPLTGREREREVRDRIKAEAEWQFDFSAGLFLRVVLLQISNDQHILILTTHHIVADAWSMGILTRELWTLYDAYAKGRPSPLQDLAVQYADYAVWQREWLQGEVLEPQLSYWRKQLGNISRLNFPTDRPRPAQQSYLGARQLIALSESLTVAVNELSRREGVTQFMTLLAGFHVLLYRYSRQEDVVVGSPIANRNRTETEGLIGFFVNTLVLRTELYGRLTFKELLLKVRDVCLDAYAHPDLPFEKLVQELQPERDLSRNPLFQVMFVLQNTPRPFQQASGLSIERIDIQTATSPFDLALYLREREGKLIGFFEHSTDLFESSTIERMIGHFQTLLEGIVADPEQPILTLPVLTEAERHQLLVKWNDTAADYPKDSCIHELFEAQVERTPEAIAVQFEGKQLTYRELNARADQLAHYLQGLGVDPEKLVGICMGRSLEMVVGVLGILKAGGAYVPLDPSYPRERLRFMLEDARVSVLLTQAKLVEDREWSMEDGDPRSSILDPRLQVVFVDRDRLLIAEQSDKNPLSQVYSTDLAYVIYTSGSTGKPKGVQVSHRSVLNCLHSVRQHVDLTQNDVFLAVTTISFDIAALELFLPLITGAKLVLAGRDEALDGRQLLDRLTECGATAMQATPSAWKLLLDAGWRSSQNFKILSGGEALSRQLADQLLEGGPSLWNLYGPTETTIWSTIAKIEASESPITVGRPIANTQIYILDSHLQPVPIGVHGELFIGGNGLARGYLNRPELTSERFVLNPFEHDPNARLYRTGDLAHYLADGNIGFLGRVDDQLKIRGYRIEPGEIEAALNQHPAVEDSVVVVRERDSSAEKSLVSYVVPRQQSPSLVPELRNFLERKLPEYMLPSAFVILESLPLTPNGKVDRQALPPLDATRPNLAQVFVEPRTEIEEVVAQVWKEVLKLGKVGIHDSFFELGGHSLLGVQIISRLRDTINREIPLRVLFEAPTVAEFSIKIEGLIRECHSPELPPIVPVPRDGPLPLSMNQEHLWHLDQMMPGTHFFNMPYVYQLSGELDIESLEKALSEIIRRHEALRTIFAEVDGRPVQVVKSVPDFRLPVVDLRNLEPDELSDKAAELILQEKQRSFDLAHGPLLGTKLLRLTDTEHFLLLTMHHIISDQWSVQVFRRELLTLYEAFSQGKPSPLREPMLQFADFAHWERQLLQHGRLDGQLDYWKKQLAGPLTELEFKQTGTRNKKLRFLTSRRGIELDESLFGLVKELARNQNSTPYIAVLTALNVVLYLFTGQRDIRIGTIVANRARRESEDAMGHFINTLVLRTQVNPNLSFGELLNNVRNIFFTTYAYQELPFEVLARVLEEKQGVKRDSLFQVLLSYRASVSQPTDSSGVQFASWNVSNRNIGVELTPTTFDLIFTLTETSTKLTGTVTYSVDVFDETGITSMIKHFSTVLENSVKQPGQPMADFCPATRV